MDEVTNTQNNSLNVCDPGDLSEGGRTHLLHIKSAVVMVWAAIAFDRSKSPLVFIEESVKLNT